MSNKDSSPQRISRRLRREAPIEVAAQSGSPTSAVLALTEGSSAVRNRQRREDRDQLSLLQLANVVASPLVIERYFPSALEEEENYDNACRAEQAGASDSESNGKDDNEDPERLVLDNIFAAEQHLKPYGHRTHRPKIPETQRG